MGLVFSDNSCSVFTVHRVPVLSPSLTSRLRVVQILKDVVGCTVSNKDSCFKTCSERRLGVHSGTKKCYIRRLFGGYEVFLLGRKEFKPANN